MLIEHVHDFNQNAACAAIRGAGEWDLFDFYSRESYHVTHILYNTRLKSLRNLQPKVL